MHFIDESIFVAGSILTLNHIWGSIMGMEIGGLLGLIILLIDIYAVLKIIEAPVSTGNKVMWIALILVLPVLGLIIWLLFGPGGSRIAHG